MHKHLLKTRKRLVTVGTEYYILAFYVMMQENRSCMIQIRVIFYNLYNMKAMINNWIKKLFKAKFGLLYSMFL